MIKEEFARIKATAAKMRDMCDVFLVCGIGGSYLGARAAIEMINGLYANKKPESFLLEIHSQAHTLHRYWTTSKTKKSVSM